MFFDYYAATVEADPRYLANYLERGSNDPFVEGLGRGWKQYSDGWRCASSDACVYHGGPNQHPHLRVSGESAHDVALTLREGFPDHRVTRIDVAHDFAGERAWEATVQDLAQRASRHRLATRLISSPTDPAKGQTFYVGSRSSAVFIRAYQKGKQLQEEGWSIVTDADGTRTFQRGWQGQPEALEQPNPDWVRVEIEYKPQKRLEKAAAARLTPMGVWQRRAWSAALYEHLMGAHAPYEPGARKGSSDTLSSLRHMMDQYGPTLTRACEQYGERAIRRHLAHWVDQACRR